MIVEILSLIPSILLVQLFQRIRPYGSRMPSEPTKKKMKRTLPWWWIFIAYGLSILLVALSMFFIIARGIQFGDLKSQQWLISILSSLCSSIFFTQPLKVTFEG